MLGTILGRGTLGVLGDGEILGTTLGIILGCGMPVGVGIPGTAGVALGGDGTAVGTVHRVFVLQFGVVALYTM